MKKSFFDRRPVGFFGFELSSGRLIEPKEYCYHVELFLSIRSPNKGFSSSHQDVNNRMLLTMIVGIHSSKRRELMKILYELDEHMMENPDKYRETFAELIRLNNLIGEKVTDSKVPRTFYDIVKKIQDLTEDQLIEIRDFIKTAGFTPGNGVAVPDNIITSLFRHAEGPTP